MWTPAWWHFYFLSLLFKHFSSLVPLDTYKWGVSYPHHGAAGSRAHQALVFPVNAERQKGSLGPCSKPGWYTSLPSMIHEWGPSALWEDSFQPDAIPTEWQIVKYFNLIQSVLICKMKQWFYCVQWTIFIGKLKFHYMASEASCKI